MPEPKDDPPEVARVRQLLAAYDRGEALAGEISLFRDEIEKAAQGLREGKPSLWGSSYCGSYPRPPIVGTIEVYASTIEIRPLVPGDGLEVPAVIHLLDHVGPRCRFHDYRLGNHCPRPATRFATIRDDRELIDVFCCDTHDFSHWRPADRDALLARIGGSWPPPVDWFELPQAGAIRRACAWLSANAPGHGWDPPASV